MDEVVEEVTEVATEVVVVVEVEERVVTAGSSTGFGGEDGLRTSVFIGAS